MSNHPAETKATDPGHGHVPSQPVPDALSDSEPVGDQLDPNTTYDIIVSSAGSVTELSDTVDTMDGATVEVIDIVNQADGTNLELTIVEEPTDDPTVDSVDRFVEINGMGPQVAELLTRAGIRRFSQLAETPVERIREILSVAGMRYRIHDAEQWSEQAKQLVNGPSGKAGTPGATLRGGLA